MIEWNTIRHRVERCEVRRVGKAVEHRRGAGVELMFIGGSPSICSIVRRMLVWLYCVLSDLLALGKGADDVGRGAIAADMVPARLRVVLDDQDADFLQNGEWLIASTIRPNARSLSAMLAAGVGEPAFVPTGVIVRQADDRPGCGNFPCRSNSFNSRRTEVGPNTGRELSFPSPRSRWAISVAASIRSPARWNSDQVGFVLRSRVVVEETRRTFSLRILPADLGDRELAIIADRLVGSTALSQINPAGE